MSAGIVTFCLQVVGSACSLAFASGAGKLLWLKYRAATDVVGPLPPSGGEIIGHLAVILVGGFIGLMLAVKAMQAAEQNYLRALMLALQIAGLLAGATAQ